MVFASRMAGIRRLTTPLWQYYIGAASSDFRVEYIALLVAGLMAFWLLNSGSASQRRVGNELDEKRGTLPELEPLNNRVLVSRSKAS